MTPSPVTLIKSELFRQGGLEKYTWQIAADFCALGCPVTLLTSGVRSPPFSHPLLRIVSLSVRHPLSFLNVRHFAQASEDYLTHHPTPIVFSLDRNRFQTHLRAGNGVHAAYLKRRSAEEGLLKRLSFACNPLHQTILSLEKQAFEHPQLKILFTNSNMVKQEVLHCYKTDPQKIKVIHNGVEWHAMQPAFDSWENNRHTLLHQWGLDATVFQFLFIGHNFRRKGLEKLLRALHEIRNEPFQLNVIGHDKDTPYFKELVHRLNLAQKVFFWGPQKDTLPFYQMADCLVIPSLYDPFANVTVEALAMGVFVLSSRNNGGHEVLTSQNGAVIESLDDLSAFSSVLKQVLNHPKTPLRAAAIRQTVQHLDFSQQLRQLTQSSLSIN
jgi:UDP-glucose:(heptosyl)LPS alpha-1,3-glucosyltransferase